MRLLVFSDVHADAAALERLVAIEADYYFCAGDLVSWGTGLDRFGVVLRKRAPRVYVLPGNHESAEQIGDFCRKFRLHYFHGKSFAADGYHLAGLGYSNPTPFNTPGEYSEDELAERLEPFAPLKPLILVCHCPPFETPLDRLRQGMHAGSRSIRRFIEKHQPEYFFCGHIHEAEGASARLGSTRAINAGKRGYLLEVAARPAAGAAPGTIK